MAVYTHVSAEEISAFMADYDAGEVLSFKGIAEGVENSNYILKTTEASYILTLYEKRVNPDDLPFFLGLMDHLVHKGTNCAFPVRDRAGNILKTLCGRPAALISFLEGLSINRPGPEHCQQLGQAMAGMHQAAADFDIRRENALSVAGWRELVNACAGRADEVMPGLSDILQAEMTYLEAHWPKGLPEGVIHADLFPDNVFFRGGELSGLIDYYFACNDILAYDVAISLNAWCFETDGAFNITKASRLLRGYGAVRPMTEMEIQALSVLCRGAAFRFLLSRLYDWLNQVEGALVQVKDPMEYVTKLKFHQAVTSPSEYGLDI
ncbi:homoserine kinase [Paremcibacter congregatus]|uniref:Homoserine kinase n=1 Tax=Paremcibacter congregatus TaxID=2043170 RepID=A0A2G4YLQ0_9PROT|nr:homoserine kinase [Paremcibacter congregatus]PHZ83242.1 homoserine kinase [Paremcibacter congregatus]QDE28286.1 homoserine kinase [Paremcibacter congregatus]